MLRDAKGIRPVKRNFRDLQGFAGIRPIKVILQEIQTRIGIEASRKEFG